MVSVLIILLFLFLAAEAWVLYYFFVVRQDRADKEYKEKLEKIYGRS